MIKSRNMHSTTASSAFQLDKGAAGEQEGTIQGVVSDVGWTS